MDFTKKKKKKKEGGESVAIRGFFYFILINFWKDTRNGMLKCPGGLIGREILFTNISLLCSYIYILST